MIWLRLRRQTAQLKAAVARHALSTDAAIRRTAHNATPIRFLLRDATNRSGANHSFQPQRTRARTMATAKKTTKTAPATKAAKTKAPAATAVRPIKDTFTKGALTNHLAELSGVEPKAVKAVLAALETTVLGAVNKKGAGEFTLPGLLKIGVQKVPAKPKRKGINPFTKEEQVFAAKPATVRIKARALKKLKDAAL